MKEKLPLVSIVLPIYNVEKYLDKCISSITNQTYKNLQIILVDDGSPDACPIICDNWAKKDARITVIHKENAGLGYARNTGIDEAVGDYICFFDSDDYLHEELIARCVSVMSDKSCDFIVYGFCDVTEDEMKICDYVPTPSKSLVEGDDVRNLFIKHMFASEYYAGERWNIKLSSWNCMYSMKVIRDMDFKFVSEREIISEDVYSLLNLYAYLNRVAIINDVLYFHRVNLKSLTHVFREDRLDKLDYFYIKLLDVCEALDYDQEIMDLMSNPYLNGMIGALKMIINTNCLTDSEKKALFHRTVNGVVFQKAISSVNLKCEKLSRRLLLFLFKYRWNLVSYSLLKYKRGD